MEGGGATALPEPLLCTGGRHHARGPKVTADEGSPGASEQLQVPGDRVDPLGEVRPHGAAGRRRDAVELGLPRIDAEKSRDARFLGTPRLYDYPRAAGFGPRSEADINPEPQPFA